MLPRAVDMTSKTALQVQLLAPSRSETRSKLPQGLDTLLLAIAEKTRQRQRSERMSMNSQRLLGAGSKKDIEDDGVLS